MPPKGVSLRVNRLSVDPFLFEKSHTVSLFLADEFDERQVRLHPSAPVRLTVHGFSSRDFLFEKSHTALFLASALDVANYAFGYRLRCALSDANFLRETFLKSHMIFLFKT
jgi:hypothetical protein